MKVLLAVLIFTFAVCSSTNGQMTAAERLQENPHKIQRIRTEKVVFGEKLGKWLEISRVLLSDDRFDIAGNLLESIHPESRTVKIYNDNYKVIEEIHYDNKGVARDTLKYEYDDGGRMAVQYYFSKPEVLSSKTIYTYNESGQIIESAYYNANNQFTGKSVLIFDERKRLREKHISNGAGLIRQSHSLIYDQHGNVIESIGRNADGSYANRTSCENTEQGSVCETFDAKHKVFTHYFDQQGHSVKMTRYQEDGSLSSEITYLRNEKGEVVEEKEINADGLMIKHLFFAYEYDSAGNSIKETKSQARIEKGKAVIRPIEVVYSTISYFKN
jgi:hypothetical protein